MPASGLFHPFFNYAWIAHNEQDEKYILPVLLWAEHQKMDCIRLRFYLT